MPALSAQGTEIIIRGVSTSREDENATRYWDVNLGAGEQLSPARPALTSWRRALLGGKRGGSPPAKSRKKERALKRKRM